MWAKKAFEREEEKLQKTKSKRENTQNDPPKNIFTIFTKKKRKENPKLDVDNLGYQVLETFFCIVLVLVLVLVCVQIRLQTSYIRRAILEKARPRAKTYE